MKRSHVDVTADFGNIEILPHRCLVGVTVAWPRMWLMGAKIRLALGVVPGDGGE